RDVQRRIKFHNLGWNLTAANLLGLLMFLADVHAAHHHMVILDHDGDDFAAFTEIFAGDHFYGVALLNPLHSTLTPQPYSVSGASETIFKKPFSRSSRATGPNTRVPRGFSMSSASSTAALSSNLMYEPSLRRYSFAVRTITAFTTSL